MNRKGVLIVVESDAKARTISACLGPSPEYSVFSTNGRLIDLPRSRMGIDSTNNFEPEYLTVRGKAKLLREFLRRCKTAALVLAAGDNDREGEAYSFLIRQSVWAKYPELPVKRMVMNELRPNQIAYAFRNPREIDMAKVEAQKARRVLDRLVGYNLSPILWRKVKNGLSAGRVQSVALHLVCGREKDVQSFVPREYWGLTAGFKSGRVRFSGRLISSSGRDTVFNSEKEAAAVINSLTAGVYTAASLSESEIIEEPEPPFTTSTLQQCAAERFGFSGKKTMRLARDLYEGLDLAAEGGSGIQAGLITYMRSESVRVSGDARRGARAFIGREYPAELPAEIPQKSAQAQEGSGGSNASELSGMPVEAIRPTDVEITPDSLKSKVSRDLYLLYALIWERFIASQMSAAKRHNRVMTISAGSALFRTDSSRLVEEGFYKALIVTKPRSRRGETVIPELQTGSRIKLDFLKAEQYFEQGPERYTDASIVRTLDDLGIGRASTYAPTLSVLLERYYVIRKEGQLVPTELGILIDSILSEYFPAIVDTGFSVEMEKRLDSVEAGQLDWVSSMGAFYAPFKAQVDDIMRNLESKRGFLDEPTGVFCEKCGKPMIKKLGRFGFFLACSGFPACKNTRSIALARCPLCGTGEIVARRKTGTRGREFYGCTNYPKCQFISYYKPSGSVCPSCGWFLVEKNDRRHGFYKACINPACEFLHLTEEEPVQRTGRSAS